MKKLFILTGESSGDKLASTVISKLKQNNIDSGIKNYNESISLILNYKFL